MGGEEIIFKYPNKQGRCEPCHVSCHKGSALFLSVISIPNQGLFNVEFPISNQRLGGGGISDVRLHSNLVILKSAISAFNCFLLLVGSAATAKGLEPALKHMGEFLLCYHSVSV